MAVPASVAVGAGAGAGAAAVVVAAFFAARASLASLARFSKKSGFSRFCLSCHDSSDVAAALPLPDLGILADNTRARRRSTPPTRVNTRQHAQHAVNTAPL